MALTHEQQIIEQIAQAKRILIISKEHPEADTLASLLGCYLFLKKIGKNVDVIAPGFERRHVPAFLPQSDALQADVGAMRAFHISLKVGEVPLQELMYDVQNGVLDITMVPKNGEWKASDLSFRLGEDRYDLVITIDAPDMHSLGSIAREHADFLYRTTIVNVDASTANEHWGQLNLVRLHAVSSSEILFTLFERWNREAIDADVATALLAGMIAKTRSFRTPNVTPKTLTIASQLLSIGARREEIIHGLWRTRSVPTLKLWGRILSRLQQDKEGGFVWSAVTRHDLLETGALEGDDKDVIEELLRYAPEAKLVFLFREEETNLVVSLYAASPFDAGEIARLFNATGTHTFASFHIPKPATFNEAVKSALDTLRSRPKPNTSPS